MLSIDNITMDVVYDACYDLGCFFGFGATEGFWLWLIFIGCGISFVLGGGKKRVR